MNEGILFEEEQRFSQKSVKGTVNVLAVLLVGGTLITFFSGKDAGKDTIGVLALIFLVLAILSYVLNKSKLTLQIRDDGVYVKFSPFHRNFQIYNWDAIASAYIRNYDGFREFGGWGLKMGPNGTSYSVNGDIGLQLVFTNSNRLLIGTQQAADLAEALRLFGKLDFPPDSFFRP